MLLIKSEKAGGTPLHIQTLTHSKFSKILHNLALRRNHLKLFYCPENAKAYVEEAEVLVAAGTRGNTATSGIVAPATTA